MSERVDWLAVRRRAPTFMPDDAQYGFFSDRPRRAFGDDGHVSWPNARPRVVWVKERDRFDVIADFDGEPPEIWQRIRNTVRRMDFGSITDGYTPEGRVSMAERIAECVTDDTDYHWATIRKLLVSVEIQLIIMGSWGFRDQAYWDAGDPWLDGLHACFWIKWVNGRKKCKYHPNHKDYKLPLLWDLRCSTKDGHLGGGYTVAADRSVRYGRAQTVCRGIQVTGGSAGR